MAKNDMQRASFSNPVQIPGVAGISETKVIEAQVHINVQVSTKNILKFVGISSQQPLLDV